jgi:hypothetical protein
MSYYWICSASIALISALAASPAWSSCATGNRTIFVVLDCNSKPVADVDVAITTCCDKKHDEGSTNENGEVAFPYAVKDICERAIFGQPLTGGRTWYRCVPSPTAPEVCRIVIRICTS